MSNLKGRLKAVVGGDFVTSVEECQATTGWSILTLGFEACRGGGGRGGERVVQSELLETFGVLDVMEASGLAATSSSFMKFSMRRTATKHSGPFSTIWR